jgi:hypothetical protein
MYGSESLSGNKWLLVHTVHVSLDHTSMVCEDRRGRCRILTKNRRCWLDGKGARGFKTKLKREEEKNKKEIKVELITVPARCGHRILVLFYCKL